MDFDCLTGNVMRAGVIASSILILIGVALLFVTGHSNGYDISQISSLKSPVNTSVFPPVQVIKGVGDLQPLDLIFFGLMVLIATPVTRVVIGVARFVYERNPLYTVITIVVLFNLMFAIFFLPILLGK